MCILPINISHDIVCVQRLALETDLKIEREWRGTLQQSLDKEKTKVAKLQADVQHLDEMKKVTNNVTHTQIYTTGRCGFIS